MSGVSLTDDGEFLHETGERGPSHVENLKWHVRDELHNTKFGCTLSSLRLDIDQLLATQPSEQTKLSTLPTCPRVNQCPDFTFGNEHTRTGTHRDCILVPVVAAPTEDVQTQK